MELQQRLSSLGIIPFIAIDKSGDIIPACEALDRAGLPVAEITFRTPAGREALRVAAERFPHFLIGAGTVTQIEEAEVAHAAGVAFAVYPGTNPHILGKASHLGLPFFPGVCTPTDIELAMTCGASLLKVFPAEPIGGLPLLDALHAPYRHRGVTFIPTGEINPANLAGYLRCPAVTAIGCTWLVTKDLLARRDFEGIEQRVREAVSIRCQLD
jgi:2-dehydro-3-deoxyphosphogluconate aldolase / (4S)-4-hydroxy-2-oxoglutarate aldolase